MKKDPTAEELAQWLRQLCPGREADFVRALRWLYDHPPGGRVFVRFWGGRPPAGAAFVHPERGTAGIPGPGGLAPGGGKGKSRVRKREKNR